MTISGIEPISSHDVPAKGYNVELPRPRHEWRTFGPLLGSKSHSRTCSFPSICIPQTNREYHSSLAGSRYRSQHCEFLYSSSSFLTFKICWPRICGHNPKEEKMHILVTNDDGPPSAGSSPYVHSFVRALQKAGHTVSVCLPRKLLRVLFIAFPEHCQRQIWPKDRGDKGERNMLKLSKPGPDEWVTDSLLL